MEDKEIKEHGNPPLRDPMVNPANRDNRDTLTDRELKENLSTNSTALIAMLVIFSLIFLFFYLGYHATDDRAGTRDTVTEERVIPAPGNNP